jgi:hypothetical protein
MKLWLGFILNFLYIIPFCRTQASVCNVVVKPSSWNDCNLYDQVAAGTVCCFINGVYGGNNGTACLSVDILFQNRTTTYSVNGMSGTMICGNSTTNNAKYLNVSIIFTVIILIMANM